MSRSIKKPRDRSERKAGRPRAEVDLKQLEKLCELQCTQEELATFFRVSLSTIKRLAATPEVRQLIDRGAALGRIAVRRQQFKLLREGSATMAIWLGKQYLGQRDKVEQTLRTPPGDAFRIEAEVSDRRQALLLNELFAPEEIAAAHQKMLDQERAAHPATTDHGQTPKVH
ncbi:MAG TPA: hypothetical protein VFC39_01095 [Acidobacteriaceae bacterium]|nr:hypothetical protein [Acidobacteriaceae bacterium]